MTNLAKKEAETLNMKTYQIADATIKIRHFSFTFAEKQAFFEKENTMAKQAQNRKEGVLYARIDKNDGMATFTGNFGL